MRPAITFLNIQLSNSRDHFKDSAVELVRARDQKREETGFRKIGSYIEIKSCRLSENSKLKIYILERNE